MIKDALSVLPARPAFIIAPLIAVLVLVFYYGELHSKCDGMKQHRAALNEYLHSADARAPFLLRKFTNFNWDTVRIVSGLKAGGRSVECPFGWNWPDGERDALIESGLLGAIIFGYKGAIVKYLELRGDEVAFRGADSSLTPQTAVFEIEPGDSPGVTLVLATPEMFQSN
jgi:hypothetical protein